MSKELMPIQDQTDLLNHDGPVYLVNIFRPKEGKLDEFIQTQMGEYRRLQGKVADTVVTDFTVRSMASLPSTTRNSIRWMITKNGGTATYSQSMSKS